MIALWSMVKVHGLMVVGPGMKLDLSKILGSQDGRGAGAFGNRKSNVVSAQAGYLACPKLKRLKRKFIVQTTGLRPFRCSVSAPSSAENEQVGRL